MPPKVPPTNLPPKLVDVISATSHEVRAALEALAGEGFALRASEDERAALRAVYEELRAAQKDVSREAGLGARTATVPGSRPDKDQQAQRAGQRNRAGQKERAFEISAALDQKTGHRGPDDPGAVRQKVNKAADTAYL
jgi:DNA-binding FadR family transcriptional regulator